jgi:hypothetical protein
LPSDTIKYDGQDEPLAWLEDFLQTVKLQRGTKTTAMQSMSLHLKGPARNWLKTLEKESIGSWEELKESFVRYFKTTYKRPEGIEALRSCKQKSGETMRAYINRGSNLRSTLEGVSEERAIDAFSAGITRKEFIEELGRTRPKTVADMMETALKWADGEDSLRNSRARSPNDDRDDYRRRDRNSERRRKRKDRYYDDDEAEVMAGFADDRADERKSDGEGFRQQLQKPR